MSDSDVRLQNTGEASELSGLSLFDAAIQRGNGMPLDAKVHLMDLRMRSLPSFENISLQEFTDSQPGLERILRLLAQSAIDICCSLLLEKTGMVPRSYCDLLSSCEKKRILPRGLVRRLSLQLLLINNGFENSDADEVLQRHEGMKETARGFRQFLEHVKGVTAASS